jgi:putative ABC transport system ATP-binding protein
MIIETRAVATVAMREGEIVAITGPSGCGKSTLSHVMAGILRPDNGEVRYGDRPIDDWSESRRSTLRRTDFGVLFQFGQLVAELSAVENVALPLLLGGTRRRAATTAALGWLGPRAGHRAEGPVRRRADRTTVVLVTHDATVAAYADREIRLRDGVLDAEGANGYDGDADALGTGPINAEAAR